MPASTPKANQNGPPPLPPRPVSSTSGQSANAHGLSGPARPTLNDGVGQSVSYLSPGRLSPASSTLSLVPAHPAADGKRTMLIVYIHGFNGTETSFKKFPAHVHNLLTIALAESHVVHSKIYPRYKPQNTIESARDDFSKWLSPHESDDTDLVLVGHSLGGILAAEVALLGAPFEESTELYKHRVLGIVNLDVPFLGMHPGVVSTGLGSIFRPKSKPGLPPDQPEASSDTSELSLETDVSASPFNNSPIDPNFNPKFPNDIRRLKRKPLDGALNFISKNSHHLFHATKRYVTSRWEFTSCMADYHGLRRRYNRLRDLEDVDECLQIRDRNGRLLRRVRFVNYYSAATGRLKQEQSLQDVKEKIWSASADDLSLMNRGRKEIPTSSQFRSLSAGPRLQGTTTGPSSNADVLSREDRIDLELPGRTRKEAHNDPRPPTLKVEHVLETKANSGATNRPQLPPRYTTSQEHLNVSQKKTQQDRVSTDEQPSLVETPNTVYQQSNTASTSSLERSPPVNPSTDTLSIDPVSTTPRPPSQSSASSRSPSPAPSKAKKDRVFCVLPHSFGKGRADPLWVRVQMDGMDEVTAHQSLFIPSATYERLVGDTASRIEGWVQDDLTTRAVLEAMGRAS